MPGRLSENNLLESNSGWAETTETKRSSPMNVDLCDANIIKSDMDNHLVRTCGAIFFLLLLMPTAVWSLTMDSSWSANPCPPGKPFYLTINVRWTGDAGHYTPRPPQLELPQGLQKHADALSSRSFRNGQENILSYQWELIAVEEGDIPSFPVKITVHQEKKEEPSLLEIKTNPLRIERSSGRAAFFIAILILSVLILTIVLRQKKRIRAQEAKASEILESDPSLQLSKLQEALNTSRVHGNTLSFLQNANKIINLFHPENQDIGREIRTLLEQCQYGDFKLSGEEMEQWHQRLKRLVPR